MIGSSIQATLKSTNHIDFFGCPDVDQSESESNSHPALQATQGQMDGFFGQLPYKCHLEEVASVGG